MQANRNMHAHTIYKNGNRFNTLRGNVGIGMHLSSPPLRPNLRWKFAPTNTPEMRPRLTTNTENEQRNIKRT